ncbi:MAG: hypothetical protein [Lokiarchaeia virus VerdaV1]|uniref:Uncharacterized protein n=1 Tax=Lokiarchaeia virus VerdaV1 TaxID=3070170 RepID=A0AA35CNQ0_9CAUD|nr:MAG: hypothetical protein QIT41_gp43 [Lokiarchaeia virus VerdaV1]BDI54892.1 MAG: hypothetical protein [Lokiarchaeia virus VerdaV1]
MEKSSTGLTFEISSFPQYPTVLLRFNWVNPKLTCCTFIKVNLDR